LNLDVRVELKEAATQNHVAALFQVRKPEREIGN
jgi:hypothetical protein